MGGGGGGGGAQNPLKSSFSGCRQAGSAGKFQSRQSQNMPPLNKPHITRATTPAPKNRSKRTGRNLLTREEPVFDSIGTVNVQAQTQAVHPLKQPQHRFPTKLMTWLHVPLLVHLIKEVMQGMSLKPLLLWRVSVHECHTTYLML